MVELVHLGTGRLLNSHDVAAPLSPALQEVAGSINYSAQFIPHLQWMVVSLHVTGQACRAHSNSQSQDIFQAIFLFVQSIFASKFLFV